jgi:methyl-accepting chemotaxis protein
VKADYLKMDGRPDFALLTLLREDFMSFFFRSLKISQKLWLSILSFSVPILMLLYLAVTGNNSNINFARLEVLGNRILDPLTQLLVFVPQHQRLGAVTRADNRSFLDNSETTTNLIEKNIELLEKETKAIGELLKITPSELHEAGMEQLLPEKIADQWQTLRSSKTSSSQDQLARQYGDLTQRIRRLIDRVGDTSNLILDPDLDSYYLMDVILVTLPQAQQRVGEILLLCQRLTSQTQLTNEVRVKLEVYASLLQQSDLARIVQDVEKSLREDKNFYGVIPSLQKNLPSTLSLYDASVKKFNEKLIQLARAARGDSPNRDFFELGEEVLRKGLELETVGIRELNKLLDQRIQYYQKQRFIYLVLSLTALAIFGQLLMAIKHMIRDLNSLIRQTKDSGFQVATSATQLLANAKQQERVVMNQVESTDEVLISVKEISQLTERLVQKMGEVASKSEETAEFASHGQSDLVHMEKSMQKVENASNTIYNKLQIIKEKGEKITFVITTMTKIADQINILSLNAALEAEKAGKSGVGFAVVAREIRRLADQTGVAALDIEKMVQETQLAVSDGVGEIDSFIIKLRQSVANISQISAQLTKIIEQVQALSPSFEEVNMSMQNQSENAKTINESMVYLGQGMQQIQNSLGESYSAIEQLNEAAIGLRERVSRFQVEV